MHREVHHPQVTLQELQPDLSQLPLPLIATTVSEMVMSRLSFHQILIISIDAHMEQIQSFVV